MGHASDLTLITLEFIFGIWVAMIPLGLLIYCHVKAWRATDVALSNLERFKQMINNTVWESFLVLLLMIVLRKLMISAMKYARELEDESD